jgi:hypothetical protein
LVQRGDEILASSWTGRAADLLWLKLVVLRDEVLVGSRDLARIGLVGIALTLQTIVLFSPGHFRPAGIGAYAVQVSVGTLGALLACFLAAFSLKGTSLRLRQGLGTIALVSLFVLSFMGVWHTVERIPGIVHGTPYTNDGAVMDLYAAS